MILSGNSLAHLLVLLGAYTAGVPILPISTAYSLLSRNHERVRAIAALCSPGMVFAEDAKAFGPCARCSAPFGSGSGGCGWRTPLSRAP
jgi:feruloyl-CoA synthase